MQHFREYPANLLYKKKKPKTCPTIFRLPFAFSISINCTQIHFRCGGRKHKFESSFANNAQRWKTKKKIKNLKLKAEEGLSPKMRKDHKQK